jgi:RNA polymerase sigma factor (sigma-70 family)
MSEHDWLAERFEQDRPRLRAVAYRMLGSLSEADDAVQEAWLRLGRSDTSAVQNLGGWLTTIVARVALNMLQSRASRREDLTDTADVRAAASTDPEQETVLADSVGLALLVVLDTLTPAERLAFVLHDMFAVPFEEIAPIVDRSPAAARQLASRARRRVQRADAQDRGAAARDDAGGTGTKEDLIRAFLAASRGGDFEALLAMLDPGIVMRADQVAVQIGAADEVRGADAVARVFAGGARAARPALIDGDAGLVWALGGAPRVAFLFTVAGGTITAINLRGELDHVDITMLRSSPR